MIVVTAQLVSARSRDDDRHLGSITIDNIGGTLSHSDYRVVLYSAGVRSRVVREAVITGWARNAKTAQALVAEAYKVLFP